MLSQAGLLEETLAGDSRTAQFVNSLESVDSPINLPPFVRPLPAKIASEDVAYLRVKGALTLPDTRLQNALLQAYVEYVHPYMPLMDLHDFLGIINSREGLNGQVSLFLYHAVMFAATAFVDRKYLREAGYATRKAARKSYFHKTRVSLQHLCETRSVKATLSTHIVPSSSMTSTTSKIALFWFRACCS